ncbi:hypothetical protein D3C72_774380 [compost metagenome]
MKALIQGQPLLQNTNEYLIMKKIAILGSCVTKDAFKYNDGSLDVKHAYYPRASIISLVSSPLEIDEKLLSAQSEWLNQIIINDFRKTTLLKVATHNPYAICVDLIEERFDIVKVQDGSYITFSDELVKYYANHNSLASNERISFYDKKRKALFLHSLEKLCSIFNEDFSSSKIIIHRALFSDYFIDSGKIKKFSDEKCQRNKSINSLLCFGYDYLESNINNSSLISLPPQLTIANNNHIWGLSPYHYIDEYYEAFFAKLIEEVN